MAILKLSFGAIPKDSPNSIHRDGFSKEFYLSASFSTSKRQGYFPSDLLLLFPQDFVSMVLPDLEGHHSIFFRGGLTCKACCELKK